RRRLAFHALGVDSSREAFLVRQSDAYVSSEEIATLLETIENGDFGKVVLGSRDRKSPAIIDNRTARPLRDMKFQVALSFPGERRAFVSRVVSELRSELAADAIFYDRDYTEQLAQPNLDALLETIYRNSRLIVVFLCQEYAQKEWCGLELRVIREIIKS